MQLYTSNGYYLDIKNVTATNSPPVFVDVFGGSFSEYLEFQNLIIQTSDGGYLLSGSTSSYGVGGDIWVFKLKQDGTLDWNRTFGGNNTESPTSLIETSDNKYLVSGYIDSYDVGGGDIWLLKVNVDGTLDWNKSFGGNNIESPTSLIETSDNKYLVSGSTTSYGAGNQDIWLLMINVDGTLDWNKTFGGNNIDYPNSLINTSDNKFLVAGSTASYGSGNYNIWLLKINVDGSLDWNKTFGGDGDGYSRSLIETSDNKYLLSGYLDTFTGNNYDIWAFKVNEDGSLDWNKFFGGTNQEYSKSAIETTDGYLIIGTNSYIYDVDYDYSNYYIIKTDYYGNIVFEKSFGGKTIDYPYSIFKTSDGGIIIGGITASYGGVLPEGYNNVSECDGRVDSSGNFPSTNNILESVFWQGCDY